VEVCVNVNQIAIRMKIASLAVLAVVLSLACAAAQTAAPSASPGVDQNAQRITQIFTASHISPDWFTSKFLEQVPVSKLETIVGQLKFGLGDFKSVKKSTQANEDQFPPPWGRYLATFKQGTDDIYIHLDETGKVEALFFRTPHTTF